MWKGRFHSREQEARRDCWRTRYTFRASSEDAVLLVCRMNQALPFMSSVSCLKLPAQGSKWNTARETKGKERSSERMHVVQRKTICCWLKYGGNISRQRVRPWLVHESLEGHFDEYRVKEQMVKWEEMPGLCWVRTPNLPLGGQNEITVQEGRGIG